MHRPSSRSPAPRVLVAAASFVLACGALLSSSASATGYPETPAPDCGTAGAANKFAARAYSVKLDSTVAGIDVDLGPVPDTGEVSSTGGKKDATLATVNGVNLPMTMPRPLSLHAAVLHNTAFGSGNTASAYSAVLNLDLKLRNNLTELLAISADAVTAQSTVACRYKARKVDYDKTGSELVNLAIRVMGKKIVVPASAPPNTKLALPLELKLLASGSITLNEQTTVNGRHVVNAVHVRLNLLNSALLKVASIDLIISHAEANTFCGQGSDPDSCHCPVKDFVTGGGQFTQDGARVTFAVHGGNHSSGRNGGFNLVNHGTRQHIKGDQLLAYSGSGQARTLKFTCSDNTYLSGATCVAYTEDNGTPGGGKDKFGLTPGYPKRLIDRGNIVLHTPSCGMPH